eukprot:gene27846-36671_t
MNFQDVLLRELKCPTSNIGSGAVNVVRLTKDGNYCMTAGDDRCIHLFNPHKADPSYNATSTGQAGSSTERALFIKSYTGAHGYGVLDVAIASDKSKFCSAGVDKTCFLWDVASGKVIRRIQAHVHTINAVDLNEDCTVVMTASYDNTLKFWDLRSVNREPIQTLSDFRDSVTTVLAGSVDGSVRVYDMRMGRLQTDNLRDPVICVRVSEDKKSYLATCLHGNIRLVELSSGRLLNEYCGHSHKNFKLESSFESSDSRIVCVAGSSVGCHPTTELFVTGSYDGTAK